MPDAENIQYHAFLEGGWSNQNFLVSLDDRKAVLRIKNRLTEPVGFESRYFDNDLTPVLLAYDNITGDMITEYVEGRLLVESPIDPITAALYMQELHRYIPKYIRPYSVHLKINSYLVNGKLDDPIADIYEKLDWQPKWLTACHNDLNDWNVLKTDDGFCTLDWESAGENDPIFDIVGLCYGLEYSDEQFDTCIWAYQPNVNWEHVRRTRIVYQVREHAWALDRIWQGSTHEGILSQKVDTEQEILRLAKRC